MDVSENSGNPKSPILKGVSIINHPFWGTPIFGNTPMVNLKTTSNHPDILGVVWWFGWLHFQGIFEIFQWIEPRVSSLEREALVGLSVNRPDTWNRRFKHENMNLQWVFNGIQQSAWQVPPGPDLMNAFGRQIAARNNNNNHNPRTEVVYVQVKICKWFNKSCRMAVTSKQWHYLTRVWLIRWYIHNWNILYNS